MADFTFHVSSVTDLESWNSAKSTCTWQVQVFFVYTYVYAPCYEENRKVKSAILYSSKSQVGW